MDDETENTGLGGWAWYEIGRLAAVEEQQMAALTARLNTRLRPSVVDPVENIQAENAALREELNAARVEAEALRSENVTLRTAWQALRAQVERSDHELRELKTEHSAVNAAYDAHRRVFEELYSDYLARGQECVLLDGFLEEIAAKVKAEDGRVEPEKAVEAINKILADLAALRV